jgi:hypothetical protein
VSAAYTGKVGDEMKEDGEQHRWRRGDKNYRVSHLVFLTETAGDRRAVRQRVKGQPANAGVSFNARN